MLFVNNTPLPAVMVPNAEGGDTIAALVVACATYRFVEGAPPNESLRLAAEQRPVVQGVSVDLLGDDPFIRAGVSVGAVGHVFAPGGEAKRGDVVLTVGSAERTIAAFGARVWQRGALGVLVPSSPRPFSSIPMTWTNAFGGSVVRPAAILDQDGRETFIPEHVLPYALNADGTGFYHDEKGAENQALPFLEDATELVSKWNDRPTPLCLAPYSARGGLRVLAAVVDGKVDFNRGGLMTHRTVPHLVFSEVAPGTRISLAGMRRGAEVLAFDVPDPPAQLEVGLEGRNFTLDLLLDAVDIDAEKGDVRLVYRRIFRYPLLEGELRVARLEGTPRLTNDVKQREREA